MKLFRLILAILLLLGILLYTGETLDVLHILGKNTGNFVKEIYQDLKHADEEGAFDAAKKDLQEKGKELQEHLPD